MRIADSVIAETIPCRRCGAAVDEPCVVARGRTKGYPASQPHQWRIHQARERQRQRWLAMGATPEMLKESGL